MIKSISTSRQPETPCRFVAEKKTLRCCPALPRTPYPKTHPHMKKKSPPNSLEKKTQKNPHPLASFMSSHPAAPPHPLKKKCIFRFERLSRSFYVHLPRASASALNVCTIQSPSMYSIDVAPFVGRKKLWNIRGSTCDVSRCRFMSLLSLF